MAIPGKATDIYKNIRPLTRIILEGTVACIDPSIGSRSSMPGWAIYRQGKLLKSGILELDPSLSLAERAKNLYRAVYHLYRVYTPDILVYEEIPDQAYTPTGFGNRAAGAANAKSHSTLLKAVGVILAVPGPDVSLGLRPMVWKKRARDSYIKGDEADAIEMGHVAIILSREIEEEEGEYKHSNLRRRK